jgi:hypothetical protein
MNAPYLHEDGTTPVNMEDPAWELALAEVAKDTNRIVTNAPLAAVADAAEAEGGHLAEVEVVDGNGVVAGSDDEDEGEEEMSAGWSVAELEQHLLQASED